MAKTQKIETPKPTIVEQITQIENEIKQIEAEYHKRLGKLELLREMDNTDTNT